MKIWALLTRIMSDSGKSGACAKITLWRRFHVAAYVIVKAEITDWDKFRQYLSESPRIIAQYGGKYIARGGEMEILEGDNTLKRMVIIEFPSLEKAREWYHSEEYQRIKQLRKGAATGSLIALEGCSD
jgi:uncharacterized protein (DUF1330 family)